MNKSELLAMISHFPEKCLEEALTDFLAGLIAACEYALAEQILAIAHGKLKEHDALKIQILALGVLNSIRSRDIEHGFYA